MGCPNSKYDHSKRKWIQEDESDVECDSEQSPETKRKLLIEQYDNDMVKSIRRDLDHNPEMFVLNNVLMSTIFQKNYYKDVTDTLQTIRDSTSQFIEPEILVEKINKNVIYRPIHGAKKDQAQPLITRRLYVPMNEFIEIYNPMDDQDEVDASSDKFHVKMERSKRIGYVKLRQINDSTQTDQNSVKDMLSVPVSSTSASSDTESSENTIEISSPTPQLLRDQQEEYRLQDCLVFRKVKKEDIDIMLDELDHETMTEDDVYDVVGYLNSRTFMKFFQSKIFKSSTAKELGLIQHEIDNAYVLQYSPGKVFCNLLNNDGDPCPAEVIPCLRISWPERETYDFLNREVNGKEPWPDPRIMQEFRQQNCVLVPRGYSKKPGEYPEGDLEWEIHFPYTERYMECLLRPEQIKCYMVLLGIHKEYIHIFTNKRGILPEHYKTLVFREAENNYNNWPEHRLGTKCMDVFAKFSQALMTRTFPDYFIRKKNLFKNGSRTHFERANEVFHQVLQSPLPMILRVLRNIRYTSGSYYPPLDYTTLMSILYRNDWESDNIFNVIAQDDGVSMTSKMTSKGGVVFNDAEKQLKYAKHRREKQRIINKMKKRVDSTKLTSYSIKTVRRDSVDSIKDDWVCERTFHRQKKIALLKFFIRNFLDIAKVSSKIGTKRQTLFYIKQAGYLVRILGEENELFKDEVNEIADEVKLREQECILNMTENMEKYGVEDEILKKVESQTTDDASMDDVHQEVHQQIRLQRINLRTLNRAYTEKIYSDLNASDDLDPET